jgi:hypothetical protein
MEMATWAEPCSLLDHIPGVEKDKKKCVRPESPAFPAKEETAFRFRAIRRDFTPKTVRMGL